MGFDADGKCSCSEARAQLEAFLDHECEKAVEERLREHVASCEHCSRVADAQLHLREIVRSRCVEQAPAELRARVLGQLSMMRAGQVTSVETYSHVVTDGEAGTTYTTTYTRTTRF